MVCFSHIVAIALHDRTGSRGVYTCIGEVQRCHYGMTLVSMLPDSLAILHGGLQLPMNLTRSAGAHQCKGTVQCCQL